MNRSEINRIMKDAKEFIRSEKFYLPPFAFWSPESWHRRGREVEEIVENKLGWDITDFGMGNFQKIGLFLFTIRNGKPENLKTLQGKLYAEKVMIIDVDQVTPFHFHWKKTEDIINRGGGDLLIQLYNATQDEQVDKESHVRVATDGVWRSVAAGGIIRLTPGESITLEPYCYHQFWAEESPVLAGEVSTVNDDEADNRFSEPVGRFPEIVEDEPPLHLLVTDYPLYYKI